MSLEWAVVLVATATYCRNEDLHLRVAVMQHFVCKARIYLDLSNVAFTLFSLKCLLLALAFNADPLSAYLLIMLIYIPASHPSANTAPLYKLN